MHDFVSGDIIRQFTEEKFNDKIANLDKNDQFYNIKYQTNKNEYLEETEAAEQFDNKKNKNKRKKNLIDYSERQKYVLSEAKVKSLIDFDEQQSASIKSLSIEKNTKIKLTTRFLNGKMLMFSKLSIKAFVYDMIDVFMFSNQTTQQIYQKYGVEKCFLEQNLADTDSTSIFFIFICNLSSDLPENEARKIIFEVMLNSKIFNRLDRSDKYFEQFNARDVTLKKKVGYFEIEQIDKDNIITIALNPKEYYERFIDSSFNKKHKGLSKSVRGMDFDSYSSRLSDLTEYFDNFIIKPNQVKRIEQKRFQIKDESMQMTTIHKVQFGQLNDKRFYFPNGITSLPFGHPHLEKVRKQKNKFRNIHKIIQYKKHEFLEEEAKVEENSERLNILNQIFNQVPLIYELKSNQNFFKSGLITTKNYIKNSYWK